MKKGIIFVMLAFLDLASIAFAADTMILNKHRDSVLTGTVTEVRQDSFYLENGGNVIAVDVDDLDLDKSVDNILTPGMKVTVEGRFTDDDPIPVFTADQVIVSAHEGLNPAEALLLQNKP